jgi:hypothetical protein
MSSAVPLRSSASPAPRLDEAVVATRRDDHMVARHYSDQLCRGPETLRQVCVVRRWGRIAAYAELGISGVMRTSALCGLPTGTARRRAIGPIRSRHNPDAAAVEVRS